MLLRPCTHCRRHVGLTEERCPFCHALLEGVRPRPAPPGAAARLSRAAIFAGALAGTACGGGAKQQRIDNQQQHQTVERGPLVPGMIRGIVRHRGRPVGGFEVTLRAEHGAEQKTMTNDQGHYEFTGLEPGNYLVISQPTHPREAPLEVPVTLEPEAGYEAPLDIHVPEPDQGPCCKPYGAPPARRRLV